MFIFYLIITIKTFKKIKKKYICIINVPIIINLNKLNWIKIISNKNKKERIIAVILKRFQCNFFFIQIIMRSKEKKILKNQLLIY